MSKKLKVEDELLLLGLEETDKYLDCMEFIVQKGLVKEFNEFLKAKGENNGPIH